MNNCLRWTLRSALITIVFISIGLGSFQEGRRRKARADEIRKIESRIASDLKSATRLRIPPGPDYETTEKRLRSEYHEQLIRVPDTERLFSRLRAEHDAGEWDRDFDPSTAPPFSRQIRTVRMLLTDLIGAGEPLSWDPLWLLLAPVVGVGIALAIRARKRKTGKKVPDPLSLDGAIDAR